MRNPTAWTTTLTCYSGACSHKGSGPQREEQPHSGFRGNLVSSCTTSHRHHPAWHPPWLCLVCVCSLLIALLRALPRARLFSCFVRFDWTQYGNTLCAGKHAMDLFWVGWLLSSAQNIPVVFHLWNIKSEFLPLTFEAITKRYDFLFA